jgi:uncharacterized protein YbjT (DUF2867 family)
MRVLVFGATGKTGSLVVERALAKGHEVSVLVRDPARFTIKGVRVFQGDATNPGDVGEAMPDQDAVIDTIGGTTPFKSTSLETDAANAAISAMKAEGVWKLVVVSMMGLGESRAQAPFWYKYLLMPTFLHGSTQDKTNMETAVAASGLNYVIVRPPLLKDDPPTGSATVLEAGRIGHQITRGDLANFLVEQLSSDIYIGRTVTVVNS